MPLTEIRPQLSSRESEGGAKRHLTYNPDFDSNKYARLLALEFSDAPEYEQKKTLLDAEVVFNLKTTLRERFNAALSTRRDRVLNGNLYSQHSDEPLVTMFERGQAYRYANSSEHDRIREQAEVEGFQKINALLADPNTEPGTMMLLFSPPGGETSDYTHNFYDVFKLVEENGERFVDYVRYSSDLDKGEYAAFASIVQPGYFADKERLDLPYDAYFLSRPVTFMHDLSYASPDDIRRILNHGDSGITQEEMEYIEEQCMPFILAYLRVLAEYPYALEDRNKKFNAILNKADAVKEQGEQRTTIVEFRQEVTRDIVSEEEVDYWGRLPVREVMTGCGFSGGLEVGGELQGSVFFATPESTIAPFSVLDSGGNEDRYGKLTFKCPHCNFENKRPYNTLIKYCQNSTTCGKDVSC